MIMLFSLVLRKGICTQAAILVYIYIDTYICYLFYEIVNYFHSVATTLRKLYFIFLSNSKKYDCCDNFLLIMNQMELCFANNQKKIVKLCNVENELIIMIIIIYCQKTSCSIRMRSTILIYSFPTFTLHNLFNDRLLKQNDNKTKSLPLPFIKF